MMSLLPRSLGNRLFLSLLCAGLTILALQVVAELRDEVSDTIDLMDDLLEIDIDRIAASISPGPPPALSPEIEDAYDRTGGDRGFFVVAADGTMLGGVNAQMLPKRPDVEGGVSHEWLGSFPTGQGTVWAAAEDVRLEHGRYWIFAMRRHGGDDAYLAAALDEVMEGVLPTSAPSILLMLALSMLVVRLSLRPLRRVAAQAGAITGRQSAGRLEEAGLPSEIRTLVHAINEALERLDRSLRFQREFTEDVAHELRTPLSVLMLRLERLSDHDVAAELKGDVRALIRFIEQLLEAAQIDALQIRLDESADLDAIARDTVAGMAPLALHAGKQIVLESDDAAATRGNVQAIALALRNLIENALKASPAGGTVVVRAGPGPTLAVVDEGPGVDPALRTSLFERFWQRDRRRSGAGLGLAIVRKTVDAHGGTLTVSDNRPNGAVFVLAFPPA